MVQNPQISDLCYQPATIDSLTYDYVPQSNKLNKVTDKAPCLNELTLPDTIDRDIIYAANQIIHVNNTTVKPNVTMELIAGDEVKIHNKLHLPKVNGLIALVTVKDQPCPDAKQSEGFNQQSEGNFVYDSAGNLTYDPNKKLTFQYNYLNLAYQIIGQENDTLSMLYSADGSLLERKYVRNSVAIQKINYLNQTEIINNEVKNIYHKDGRLEKLNGGWMYEYWLHDHLGSVRSTFRDENSDGFISLSEVNSRKDNYAFGLGWAGANYKNSTRFGYTGKEEVNVMDSKISDFGARNFDKTLGRWLGVDKLSSDYSSASGYAYVLNNPIFLVDPDGMRVDSSYLVNTRTNEVTTIDDRGGTKTDYIYLWNGYPMADNRATMYLLVKDVEDIYTNNRGGGLATTKIPGYLVHNTNTLPSGAVTPFDDPFTGGLSKAGLGLAGGLFALIRTSSKSKAPSVVYTIYNADKSVFKFGVSDASLKRYNQVLKNAGTSRTGSFTTSVLPKYEAHIYEKYLRSLHYASTNGTKIPGMKVPFPVNLETGKIYKP
jgi:RHS repeat-associated protein